MIDLIVISSSIYYGPDSRKTDMLRGRREGDGGIEKILKISGLSRFALVAGGAVCKRRLRLLWASNLATDQQPYGECFQAMSVKDER